MKALMTERDTTEALVRKAQTGDQEAFDQLARRNRDRLLDSIRSWSRFQVGPPIDPDDVVQESMVRAYSSLSRFQWRDDDSFFRWLCGIAKKALSQAVQNSLRQARGDQRTDVRAEEPSPSKMLRREERFDRLESALLSNTSTADLTDEEREIFFRVVGAEDPMGEAG